MIEEKDSDLLKVLKGSYKVIICSLKNNLKNQIYTSQWLNFIINQIINTDKSVDLYQKQTLAFIIKNNEYVLENLITQEIVQTFVD